MTRHDDAESSESSRASAEETFHLMGSKEKRGIYDSEDPASTTQTRKFITGWRLYSAVLHLTVVALAVLLLQRHLEPQSTLKSQRTWSPVQHLVEYEINDQHSTDHHVYTAYSGPPRDENDKAWNKLLQPMYFQATHDDLVRAGETTGNTSAVLKDGTYSASLGVYHELHCVRMLRNFLYKEHYYPNITESQLDYLHVHNDHCLETLRLSIMCHGSTAMYTFHWEDPWKAFPATKSNSKSVCAKWSSIEDWANEHEFHATPEDFKRPDDDNDDHGTDASHTPEASPK